MNRKKIITCLLLYVKIYYVSQHLYYIIYAYKYNIYITHIFIVQTPKKNYEKMMA